MTFSEKAFDPRDPYDPDDPCDPAPWHRPTPYSNTYTVKGVGIAAVALVATTVVFEIAQGLMPLAARAMARRALANDDVDLLNQAKVLGLIGLLPYFGVFVAAGVLVIVWLYRARKNVDAIASPLSQLGAGWAIGGWLIPVANLVIPARVMWTVVRNSLSNSRLLAAVVPFWWIAWIGSNAVDYVMGLDNLNSLEALPSTIGTSADYQAYIDYYGDNVRHGLPGMIGTAIAGVLLCLLIIRVSSAQSERLATPTGPSMLPIMPMATSPMPQPPDSGGTIVEG